MEKTGYYIEYLTVQKSGLMNFSILNWSNVTWMELQPLGPGLESELYSAMKLHFPSDKILQQHKDPRSKT